MGMGIQKVIQSVKFQLSHQMKPYSSVKAIWESRYTGFSVYGYDVSHGNRTLKPQIKLQIHRKLSRLTSNFK